MPSGVKIILLHIQVRVWMKADGSAVQSGEWNARPNSVNRSDYEVRRRQTLFISQSESIKSFVHVDLESSPSDRHAATWTKWHDTVGSVPPANQLFGAENTEQPAS